MAINVTNGNGSVTKGVTKGFSTCGYNFSVAGTHKVTVNYQGLTTTFNVTVKAPTIKWGEIPTRFLKPEEKVVLNTVVDSP